MATCKVPVDGEPCGLPMVEGSNKFCAWHRLMRVPIQDQVKAAQRRLERHDGPLRRTVPSRDWPPGARWCAGCQSFVPLFYCTSSRGTELTMCRACNHQNRSRSRTLAVYGLGHEGKKDLVERQDGKCAGCRHRQVRQELAIDHSHKTGAVRGLLCDSCNHKVLGGAHDSVRILLNLAYYLINPPAADDTTWVPPETLKFSFTWKEDDGRDRGLPDELTEQG